MPGLADFLLVCQLNLTHSLYHEINLFFSSKPGQAEPNQGD